MDFHLLDVLVHERRSRLLREAEARRLRRRLRSNRERTCPAGAASDEPADGPARSAA